MEWTHASVQMELAGFALRRGWPVEFEPRLPGGKMGDLEVFLDSKKVMFEVTQIGEHTSVRETNSFVKKLDRALAKPAKDHSLSVKGHYLKVVGEEELQALLAQVDEVGTSLKEIGQSRPVKTEVAKLVITKTSHPEVRMMSGPVTSTNEWDRLAAKIRDKARQSASGQNVWLRIEVLSGLWQLTAWAQQGMKEKLKAIVPVCHSEIRRYDHVSGVILSSGLGWQIGAPDEVVCVDGNFSMRRNFATGGRQRETIIVRRDKRGKGDVGEVMRWYQDEVTWLDWALRELGYGSLEQMFNRTEHVAP
ncbi:hypothetical protein [Alicyclobacillus sp. ALC3]|uniref:hypothetical protein n=1 Tax=Alicyclobacillus sp. ALC3 TaxID=2796143 RepID=UPI002377D35D|nr:hypothetical protein [Alicyclobacillus sp. ALC3]WDL98493.1 hypothetical protein JC200_07380 [Alicyclobacillus sp. ALC3]